MRKKKPGCRRGSLRGLLPGALLLDARLGRVRPLVLIAIAAGADERRGRPGALVVGLVAAAVEPGVQIRVGHGLAGLVADEMLLVLHVGPAGDLTTAAARIRLDRVLHVVAAAAEVAVIGAVGEA